MEKKYEFTGETHKVLFGPTLHRIKAIRSFGEVYAGEEGGWIESESNLSHYDNSWVYNNAKVYGNAVVTDNAQVYDYAEVRGGARIYGDARICGTSSIFGAATVCDNVCVRNEAVVCGWASIRDNVVIRNKARIFGNAKIRGIAEIKGNARISEPNHVVTISTIGSRDDVITFMRSKGGGILVSVGCFFGTIDEFAKKVRETHRDNEFAEEYMLAIELAKRRIKMK